MRNFRIPTLPATDDAEFSADGRERLWLSRSVAETGPVGLVLGLNPSVAGATENDPTVRKAKGFTLRWGWSGFWLANLFTCIETYSDKLKKLAYGPAVGAHGTEVLQALIPLAPVIVVGWGTAVPPALRSRVREVQELLGTFKQKDAPLLCWGLSATGDPLHPLMLGYDKVLVPYELPQRASRR